MQLIRPPAPPRGGPSPLKSRGNSLLLAGLAALLAGVALLVFLRQYRESLTDPTPVRVLEAKALIPKGSSGPAIAGAQLYRVVKVRKSLLEDGAITDPDDLHGKVTSKDIFPGHQLTTTDFENSKDPLLVNVAGYDRAITVPVDTAHGMVGQVRRGDHVDVVATYEPGRRDLGPRVSTVARDALVLKIPDKAKSGGLRGREQDVTLRVTERQSTAIAYAADNGKVWILLRPKVGARDLRGDN